MLSKGDGQAASLTIVHDMYRILRFGTRMAIKAKNFIKDNKQSFNVRNFMKIDAQLMAGATTTKSQVEASGSKLHDLVI